MPGKYRTNASAVQQPEFVHIGLYWPMISHLGKEDFSITHTVLSDVTPHHQTPCTQHGFDMKEFYQSPMDCFSVHLKTNDTIQQNKTYPEMLQNPEPRAGDANRTYKEHQGPSISWKRQRDEGARRGLGPAGAASVLVWSVRSHLRRRASFASFVTITRERSPLCLLVPSSSRR